jgi:hypothetical protein
MVLLEQMIRTGRFSEFVGEILSIHNEETEEKVLWEFWCHKVFDMTYQEFLNKSKVTTSKASEKPSQEILEATVMESRDILNSFCPS